MSHSFAKSGVISRVITPALALSTLFPCWADAAIGKTFSLGTDYSSNYKIAEPVFSPEPEISSELHEQCFKSCCIAKFLIRADGETSVQLLTSTGSTEVDEIAIETLRRWKFKPAQLDGRPVESSRKIRVEFEIE